MELALDLLAMDLTNDPDPVRFDGTPPKLEKESVLPASLFDITGYLVRTVFADTGDDDAVFYYINDHLGTPQIIVDETGNIVWRGDYQPFGSVNAVVSILGNNFRFPGQYYDAETGMHYNYHRFYDPSTGRYLRPDPIGLAGGINLYAYVQNNPVNWIDPYGLFIGSIGAKVAGRIMGRTAQEAALVGKASDSVVSLGIEAAGGVPIDAPKTLGYIGDSLQAFGGVQSIGLGTGIAAYSSVSSITPATLSFIGGLEIGFAFNHFYERWRGQSLGEDIYDWLHPQEGQNPCE